MTGPAVVTRAVVKRFGDLTALNEVTVSIEPGRLVAVLGWNAAGKTTLFRLLAGLIEPDMGAITVFGHEVRRDRAAVQALVGYVPQTIGIDEFLSVKENLELRADLRDVTRATLRARTTELLQLTSLADALHVRGAALPHGARRRLGLACALVGAPRIVLLDELTAGLDPLSRRSIFQIIQHLVANGVTVLWGTSAIDEAERCDEIVLLHAGRIVAKGAPADLTACASGRTRMIKLPGVGRHEAAAVLQGRPGVLDVQVRESALCFVTDRADRAIGNFTIQGAEPPQIVPPRLEDALFILLRDHGMEATPAPHLAARRQIAGPVVEVREVCKCFGSRLVVDDLTFSVAHGEILGIAGSNGAGKSTVLKMLCGALRPTRGSIVMRNRSSGACAGAAATVGYVSQSFPLYADLTVRQNLRFWAGIRGVDPIRWAEYIGQIATECGLEPHLDARAGDLAGAMKRRLALVGALLGKPALLLLDEPSSGADPVTRRDLWRRIDTAAASGLAVIVASNLTQDIESCDKILLLNQGHAIAIGTPEELRARAASVGDSGTTLEDAFDVLVRDWEKRRAA